MPKPFDRIDRDVRDRNPYWEYRRERYILPNGDEADYYYVHTHGSVFIIPVTADDEFVLVKQHRYLNGKMSFEFPGGGVKEGVDPRDAAIAELKEEAGITAADLQHIGEFNPYNGVTDEICTVYLARGLTFGDAMPDYSEEIEIVKVNQSQLRTMIANREIWDGMTLAAYSLYRCYMEDNNLK